MPRATWRIGLLGAKLVALVILDVLIVLGGFGAALTIFRRRDVTSG